MSSEYNRHVAWSMLGEEPNIQNNRGNWGLPRLEIIKPKNMKIATLSLYKDNTHCSFLNTGKAKYRMTLLISRRQNVMTAGVKRITAGSFAPAVNMLK